MESNFLKLWEWQNNKRRDYSAFAVTTKDVKMLVWNGVHPVDENTKTHICKSGTKVLVWMASRFGDVGITDNLESPKGYNVRIDPDEYLKDIEFIEIKEAV